MKKLSSILLTVVLLFSLTACGAPNPPDGSGDVQSSAPNGSVSEPDGAQQSSEPESGDHGSVLVVYYSATGNTESVAETIARTLNGDIFAVTPAEPYSDADLNWTDENSRVNAEHNDPALREMELVSSTVENWDSYDVVFIGYPIWWGIAAWPMDSFVKANDFTGKTVIPFCTSASSGLGESGTLLADLAGTGDWQEGHRFSGGASETEVEEWLQSLDLPA